MGRILLNCDLAEGMGTDAEIIPLIDQANISCGAHAGSEADILLALNTAKQHGVTVGAHPSYPDPEHFGRRSLSMSPQALKNTLQQQLAYLGELAAKVGVSIDYVKPHGALYNDMLKDAALFEHVCVCVAPRPMMILASPNFAQHQAIAQSAGIELIAEAFADRGYSANGALMAREQPNAVLSKDAMLAQVQTLAIEQKVRVRDAEAEAWLGVHASSICVHGDTPSALLAVRDIRQLPCMQGRA